MNYIEFKKMVLHLPVIRGSDFTGIDKQVLYNQLRRWQDKGLIIRLKRGLYLLNEDDRRINPNRSFIASQIYMPSYVSLEYALNFYGLIPERVDKVTSVTTKKTARFNPPFGTFIYQHIKPEAFRGFKSVIDENGLTYFIAEPEKAIVDFLYLNLNKFKKAKKGTDIFRVSFRFQNTETLKQKRLMDLSRLFVNRDLMGVTRLFCEFVKEEKQ